MEKTMQFRKTEGLRHAVEAFCDKNGFLTDRSADRHLLRGILPVMQKLSAYRFQPRQADLSPIEKNTSKVRLPSIFVEAVNLLADLYSVSRPALLRNAEWLALETEAEVNPENLPLTTEEFRRRAEAFLSARVPVKIQ